MENFSSRIELDGINIIEPKKIHWNLTPPLLYEEIVKRSEAMIADKGSIVIYTGKSTGRSPNDKFYVRESSSEDKIWWNKDNKPFDPEKFEILKSRMVDYCNNQELFVQNCYAGAIHPVDSRLKSLPIQRGRACLSYNMFRHADDAGANEFKPQFTVLVATGFETEPEIDGTSSDVVVVIHPGQKLALISGTRYAGEVKKCVFTILNYLFPLQGILPMHCAANIGSDNKSALSLV